MNIIRDYLWLLVKIKLCNIDKYEVPMPKKAAHLNKNVIQDFKKQKKHFTNSDNCYFATSW